MISQFSWMFVGRILAAVLQLVGFALLVNWVAPAQFGIIATVIGISAVIIAFLDFGISTYVIRAWATGSAREEVHLALRLNNAITLLFAVVALFTVSILAFFWSGFLWYVLPLVIWAAGEKNADTWLCVAISDGRAHLHTISLVGRRALSVALMLVFMAVTSNGTLSYSLGVALGAIASAVYAHRSINLLFPKNYSGTPSMYRVILTEARPFWIHSFATQVRNLDTALVASFASPVVAGYYGVASKLSGPLRMVPSSIAPVLIPVVVREGVSRRILTMLAAVLLALASVYALLAMTAAEWVPFVFGDEYERAVPAVQVTCAGLILGATASLTGACLQAIGRQRLVAAGSVSASIVCIPAIIFGTMVAGATGAAVGMISSFGVQTAVFVVALLKYGRGRF